MTKQIALVTGASRGIGKAIALTLAEQNMTVIGAATSQAGAEKITAMLSDYQGHGVILQLGNHDDMAEQFQSIVEAYGAPNVLVNNAGMTQDNLTLRMKPEEWDNVINVNLTAVFRLTQLCLKLMVKAKHGRVINLASVVGVIGNAGQANYVAAKAGLIGMTKSIALEVAKRGITVNAIAPGFIETDMTSGLSEAIQQNILDKIPMGRIGHVHNIAHAVAYLASPQADYVTGSVLHVNGGMAMV